MLGRRTLVLIMAGVLAGSACTDAASSGADLAGATDGSGAAPRAACPPAELEAVTAAVDRYLEAPASDQALDLVAEVKRQRCIDDAPYLVDLIRMTGSSEVRTAAIDALANLSGLEATADVNLAYVELGSWVLDQHPEPGPRYRDFKAAVYAAIDAPFGDLLRQVDELATLVAIQWGGVPVGGIVELNDPVRVPVGEAVWGDPDEIVYAVDVGHQTIGYPRRVIGRHELSNDQTVDPTTGMRIPFAVSYCSLCRIAVAFDRRVAGRELTFRTSGLLLNSNKVMVDTETGTMWQQATGEAFAGPLAGQRLELLSARAVTFEEFSAEGGHPMVDLPAPFITDRETGTFTAYAYTNAEPLPDYLAGGRLWFPVAAVGNEEDPLRPMATLVVGGQALAVDPSFLVHGATAVVTAGDRTVLVVGDRFGVRLFDITSLDSSEVDWIVASAATEQPIVGDRGDGASVVELVSRQEAWFSWLARHPDTQRWPEV